MSLKEVKNTIIQEAEEKAEQNREEAEKKREEIISEAEEKAEQIRQETEKDIEDEKESIRQKAISNARIDAKRKKLQAKQDCIQDVFEEFRSRLSELDEEERESFVENAVEETGFQVDRIEAGKEYLDLTDHKYEETDSEGFVLVSEDGNRRRSFTLNTVTKKFRKENRTEVAEKLFDKE